MIFVDIPDDFLCEPNVGHDLELEKITYCYEPCGIHNFDFTQTKHDLESTTALVLVSEICLKDIFSHVLE